MSPPPKEELTTLVTVYAGLGEQATQIVEAIDFVDKEEKDERRKQQMGTRYKVDKAARLMKAGGFKPNMAARWSKWLLFDNLSGGTLEELASRKPFEQADFMISDGKVHTSSVSLLGNIKNEDSGNLQQYIREQVFSMGDMLTKKLHECKKPIEKKWKSAMPRFENFTSELPFPIAIDYGNDKAAGPWLFAIKVNAFRFRPESVPAPGMPQVILAMDFPLTVAVYDVAALVTEGIALNDLPAFLDTAAGQSWTPEHSLMFTLRPHSAVFIPAGFIAIIAYLNSDAGPSQPLLANAMVWTVFSTALAKDCDRNAWQAVVNFNNRFLATVAQDRIFGARADLCTRFFAAVVEASG